MPTNTGKRYITITIAEKKIKPNPCIYKHGLGFIL